MTNKAPMSREMRLAEDIMSKDRHILRTLAAAECDEQLTIARDIMQQRRQALKKLAE